MLKLGIIGAGIMGERLVRAAHGQPGVTITGIWDPAARALARLDAPALPSAAAVIAAADCVYIASPPATHLPHARAALASGKAVFCEKPLAVHMADAERFTADASGARVAVNFPFASSLAVEQLGRWLAGSEPEAVTIAADFATWPRGWQHAAATWLDRPAQGGFTREVVSHFLFLARRLFGPLRLLEASCHIPDPARSERAITARLHAGTVPVTLTGAVGSTTEDDRNSFTVTGSSGAVRLRNWATAERLGPGGWHPDPAAIPHEQARPLVLQRQLDAVARMTHGEPHRLATVAEAFEVQTVVEAILRSSRAPT